MQLRIKEVYQGAYESIIVETGESTAILSPAYYTREEFADRWAMNCVRFNWSNGISSKSLPAISHKVVTVQESGKTRYFLVAKFFTAPPSVVYPKPTSTTYRIVMLPSKELFVVETKETSCPAFFWDGISEIPSEKIPIMSVGSFNYQVIPEPIKIVR